MAIKQRILQIWDGAASSVKLCCIKFAQRVILAQTTALAMDKVRYAIAVVSRLPVIETHSVQRNGLEVSLGMLPPDHPFLDPRQLEAEATGLLDRMLGVLQDNSRYEESSLDVPYQPRTNLAMYIVAMPS